MKNEKQSEGLKEVSSSSLFESKYDLQESSKIMLGQLHFANDLVPEHQSMQRISLFREMKSLCKLYDPGVSRGVSVKAVQL